MGLGSGRERGVIGDEEAAEVVRDEVALGVVLPPGGRLRGGGVTGGGGRGGGRGGAESEAGEGLLPRTGALVEDGAVDLEGRERVGVGAGPRGEGVRGGGGERVQVGQRERPKVHHGEQLRRHWTGSRGGSRIGLERVRWAAARRRWSGDRSECRPPSKGKYQLGLLGGGVLVPQFQFHATATTPPPVPQSS